MFLNIRRVDGELFIWALRVLIALMVCGGLVCAYQKDILGSLLLFAMAGGVYFLRAVAYRHWLGWTVDHRGERQKVLERLGNEIHYEPTTREQRIQTEILVTKGRRRSIGIASVLLAVTGGAFLFLIRTFPVGVTVFVYECAMALGALAGASALAVNLFFELIYQLGYQDMEGARVLDPQPVHPGLKDVAAQKAHGDARPMTEREALDALKSNR